MRDEEAGGALFRLGRLLAMAETAGGAKAPITLPVIACLLIADCIWRLLTPGGPWPVSPWNYVNMGVDLLLTLGLVSLWRSYPTAAPTRRPWFAGAACCSGSGSRRGLSCCSCASRATTPGGLDTSEAAGSRRVTLVGGRLLRLFPFANLSCIAPHNQSAAPGSVGLVVVFPSSHSRRQRPRLARFERLSPVKPVHETPQHRHHRPRRPWQDHPRRPAPAAVRRFPRQPARRRTRHGFERPRT